MRLLSFICEFIPPWMFNNINFKKTRNLVRVSGNGSGGESNRWDHKKWDNVYVPVIHVGHHCYACNNFGVFHVVDWIAFFHHETTDDIRLLSVIGTHSGSISTCQLMNHPTSLEKWKYEVSVCKDLGGTDRSFRDTKCSSVSYQLNELRKPTRKIEIVIVQSDECRL